MPPFLTLICAIRRVLMTHIGLVTMVEEAPATIEEQKFTIFGLSKPVLANFHLKAKATIIPLCLKKNSFDFPYIVNQTAHVGR
jgi:hypothetical protein